MTDEKPMITQIGAGFDSRRLHTFPQASPDSYGEPVPPSPNPAQNLPRIRRRGFCWCGAVKPLDRRRFCSDECGRRYWGKRKAARQPATCVQCGAGFQALKDAVRKGAGVYCSTACCAAHAAATGKFAGANNPRWLGGISTDNMRYRKRQRVREPQQEAARRSANYAVSRGVIVRGPCERCGSTDKIEGHHDDYSKPLELRWLCRRHHVDVHNELRAAGVDPDKRTTTRPTQED